MKNLFLILIVFESFWYIRIPSDFAVNMKGRINNDNIFTYGVTLSGDTVTSANAQKDFPDEFRSLKFEGYSLDSMLLSPADFQQAEMK